MRDTTQPQPDPVAPESLTRRTFASFAWMSSGSGALSVVRILVLVVLARLLTPADFGLLGAGMIVVKFAELFSQIGVGPAIVQLETINSRILRTGFTLALLLSSLAAVLVWIGAPLCAQFFKMESLTPIVRVLAAIFPLNALAVVSISIMERELLFRRIAILETVSYAIGSGGIGLILAASGFGVWSLVGAVLGQSLLRAGLFLWSDSHLRKPLLDMDSLKRLLPFAGGFTLTRLMSFLALQGDSLIVGRWLGSDALGLYGRAYSLAASPVNLVGRVLSRVMFPALAKIQGEHERLASAYRRSLGGLAFILLPASASLALLAPEMIPLLLGSQWTKLVVPFQILALGVFFRAGHKISDALIRATGSVYRQALLQGIYAGLVVLGCWLAQRWGLPAVASAVLGAVIVHWLLLTRMSHRLCRLSYRDLARSLLPGAATALAVSLCVAAVLSLTRGLELRPAVVLMAGLAAAAAAFIAAVGVISRYEFGRESRQLLRTALGKRPRAQSVR